MTRIAVNQSPSGGNDYPFRQEHVLNTLLLDAFLSYDDAGCGAAFPLRIKYLYGFGTNTGASPPDDFTPTHDRDVQIVDDEDDIIFDSSLGDYNEIAWGSDRRVAEWYVDDQVLRLVWSTANEDGFEDYEAPTAAILDPRTYLRLPDRVRGIRVGETVMHGDVLLEAGYNVSTEIDSPERVDGGEFVERIILDGVVGTGAGRLPGCEEVEPTLRKLNGISPDASGNFLIETDDCIRQQLLLALDSPYTAEYAAAEMTELEAMSALKLDDDCKPCCPCDDYVYTYRGISRVWNKWADAAAGLEEIRDIYSDSRERWLAQRECRLASPLKVTTAAQSSKTIFVGANFCNMSHCCLAPVEIRVTLLKYVAGVLSGGPAVTVKEAYVTGSGIDKESPYAPEISGNQLIFRFDGADQQRLTSIRLRLCLAPDDDGDSVLIAVTVHYPDPPPNSFGEVCVMPTPEVAPIFGDVGGDTVRAVAYRQAPIISQERTYPCISCDC